MLVVVLLAEGDADEVVVETVFVWFCSHFQVLHPSRLNQRREAQIYGHSAYGYVLVLLTLFYHVLRP